jgi:hypothetical protein
MKVYIILVSIIYIIYGVESFQEKECPIDLFIKCPAKPISCSKNECCPDDSVCCLSGCGFVCVGKFKKE